jgi:hypothetical protein
MIVTAAACAGVGAFVHFLRDRMARPGSHSLANRLYSVGTVVAVDDALIMAKTREAEQDAQEHRALLERTRHDDTPIRAAEPRMCDTGPRLLANAAPALLCGDYGGLGLGPQWPSEWPAPVISNARTSSTTERRPAGRHTLRTTPREPSVA